MDFILFLHKAKHKMSEVFNNASVLERAFNIVRAHPLNERLLFLEQQAAYTRASGRESWCQITKRLCETLALRYIAEGAQLVIYILEEANFEP